MKFCSKGRLAKKHSHEGECFLNQAEPYRLRSASDVLEVRSQFRAVVVGCESCLALVTYRHSNIPLLFGALVKNRRSGFKVCLIIGGIGENLGGGMLEANLFHSSRRLLVHNPGILHMHVGSVYFFSTSHISTSFIPAPIEMLFLTT